MFTRTLPQKPGLAPGFATGCLYYPGYRSDRFILVCG